MLIENFKRIEKCNKKEDNSSYIKSQIPYACNSSLNFGVD